MQATGYEGIHTPVLLIGGVVEEADVLEVTILATKILKDMGLEVATVTKESAAGIFNFLDFKPLFTQLQKPLRKTIPAVLQYNQFFLTRQQSIYHILFTKSVFRV